MALAGKFLEKSQSIGVLGVDPCPVGRRSASLKKKKKRPVLQNRPVGRLARSALVLEDVLLSELVCWRCIYGRLLQPHVEVVSGGELLLTLTLNYSYRTCKHPQLLSYVGCWRAQWKWLFLELF